MVETVKIHPISWGLITVGMEEAIIASQESGKLQHLRRRAREIKRVAKGRSMKLAQTKDEMNDPAAIGRFLSFYGDYPSDRKWAFAARIAESLGMKLTDEQAMNNFHCGRFIKANEAKFYSIAPSLKQIHLAERLASLRGVAFPRKCRLDHDQWESFMRANLTREDEIRVEDYLSDFAIPQAAVDLANFGEFVKFLSRATDAANDPHALALARKMRIKEMLIGKEHPATVAEFFLEDENTIDGIAKRLEGEGYEISW